MKVSELKARAAVPEIELEIVSKGEVRQWTNEKGSGKVCSCAGKDKSGEISVSLWNDQIEQVEEGNKIKISNGWCSEFKGQLQVSTGKQGNLEVLK
ncbi:MAG TPA: SOSS complex subunit B family protein [archaeon]|nr:SOSS complex subunit B family protein [archaeon]